MTRKSKKTSTEITPSTQNDEDVQIIQQLRHFSGPLPSPENLLHYDKVTPGAAKRIIKMAEKNQENRLHINRIMAESDVKKSLRGQIFGFVIAAIAFTVATICAFLNQKEIGIASIGFSLVSIVSTFVLGRKAKETPKIKKKSPEVSSPSL
jgi:uncharacterized membrane protein